MTQELNLTGKKSAKSTPPADSASAKKLLHKGQANAMAIHVEKKSGGPNMQIKFGSVTLEVHAPTKSAVKQNVAAGQSALKRARNVLSRAGVLLTFDEKVPVFHADPSDPKLIIRKLKGKISQGRFVDGKFKTL
jgi:hypothetical protein